MSILLGFFILPFKTFNGYAIFVGKEYYEWFGNWILMIFFIFFSIFLVLQITKIDYLQEWLKKREEENPSSRDTGTEFKDSQEEKQEELDGKRIIEKIPQTVNKHSMGTEYQSDITSQLNTNKKEYEYRTERSIKRKGDISYQAGDGTFPTSVPKLFHFTNKEGLEGILREKSISPPNVPGRKRYWKDPTDGADVVNKVYLADLKTIHQIAKELASRKEEEMYILEVDNLDPRRLSMDERHYPVAKNWRQGLFYSGTVAYRGSIPNFKVGAVIKYKNKEIPLNTEEYPLLTKYLEEEGTLPQSYYNHLKKIRKENK